MAEVQEEEKDVKVRRDEAVMVISTNAMERTTTLRHISRHGLPA